MSGEKTCDNVTAVSVRSGDFLGWLGEKITEARRAVKTREEMAATYRSGTNAEWHAAADMHPSTAGRRSSKAERLREAATHDRIALKLRRELAMFEAVAAALGHPNINLEPRRQ